MLLLPVDSQQLHNNFPRIGDWQRIKNLIYFYSYFSVALLAGWLALGPNSFQWFFKEVPFKLYFKAVERIQVRLGNNSYWSVVFDDEIWNRNQNLSELPISGWRCFHYVHPILWQLFNIPYLFPLPAMGNSDQLLLMLFTELWRKENEKEKRVVLFFTTFQSTSLHPERLGAFLSCWEYRNDYHKRRIFQYQFQIVFNSIFTF